VKNVRIRTIQKGESLTDVEAVAMDVASEITYKFRNVHDKLVVANITILDTLSEDLSFDVIHHENRNQTWHLDTLDHK